MIESFIHSDYQIPEITRKLTLGSDGTVMKRHDDSQRSGRLAVTFGEPGQSTEYFW